MIQTLDDLTRLRNTLPWRLPNHQYIRLRLPSLAETDQERWENTLNRLQQDCGCSLGATSGLVGCILTFAIALRNIPGVWTLQLLAAFFLSAASFVIFGGLGKIGGLLLAKRRFIATCNRLTIVVSTALSSEIGISRAGN
jgi:hypothetical protein